MNLKFWMHLVIDSYRGMNLINILQYQYHFRILIPNYFRIKIVVYSFLSGYGRRGKTLIIGRERPKLSNFLSVIK
jgi:hypothetical protein